MEFPSDDTYLTGIYYGSWQDRLSKTCLDYFDYVITCIYSKLLQYFVDNDKSVDHFKLANDVFGAYATFWGSLIRGEKAGFFSSIMDQAKDFMYPCSEKFLQWLKSVKTKKKVFLITGSHASVMPHIVEATMGPDWKTYFDLTITFASKPTFWSGQTPFSAVHGTMEGEEIQYTDIQKGCIYSKGNFNDLQKFIQTLPGTNKDGKFLYIGDNVIQDVYLPSKLPNIYSISISEELSAEAGECPDTQYLNSAFWGSYFYTNTETGVKPTLWNRVTTENSLFALPNVDCLADL